MVTLPGLGPGQAPGSRRGHFFDKSIDRGPVLERFIGWFALCGIPVRRVRGTEGPFERSFFTFEWPEHPIANAHGPQTVKVIASDLARFVGMVEARRPRLIIFLSCYLWQAANLDESRAALAPALGRPLEPGRRITAERLAAWLQRWQGCTMLALPQPSKNTTDRIVASFSGGFQEALEAARVQMPSATADPMLAAARDWLVIDREQSIRQIAVNLHLDRPRAQKIFEALAGDCYESDKAGNLIARMPKP